MSCAEIYFEVVGVDVQLLGVELAQFLVRFLDVVHVLHSSVQAMQHRHTVFCDVEVILDGFCVVEVAKVGKVPLGPGVNDQTPAGEKSVRVSDAQEMDGVFLPLFFFWRGGVSFLPDQSLGTDIVIVQVGEEGLDDGALLISPLNHGDSCSISLQTCKKNTEWSWSWSWS